MSGNEIADVVALSFVVVGILVLTRPGSQGPALVDAFGGAWQGALATAGGAVPTGYAGAPTK